MVRGTERGRRGRDAAGGSRRPNEEQTNGSAHSRPITRALYQQTPTHRCAAKNVQPFCWRSCLMFTAVGEDGFETCVVFLLGYPGVGKRTIGSYLVELLDGVLVDNQLINIPLLTLFKWDGKFLLPTAIWERVGPIRDAVLGTIEDLAPKSNNYVFTNVLEDDDDGASQYGRIRSVAERRGSLFLSVMLDCEVD